MKLIMVILSVRCFIKIITLTITILGVTLPASSQDHSMHCLDEVWQRTNPTDEERWFDLENDRSFYSFSRYSCENGVSATEVETFLEKIKVAIKNNDKNSFATLIRYPFALYPEDDVGEFTKGLVIMDNPEEIIKYYDIIVNDNFRKINACASINKLVAYGLDTIMIARGYFRIETGEDMSLKLEMVGTYDEKAHEWYEKNCKSN